MFVINANNVRDALPRAVSFLMNSETREFTRVGYALVASEPVTIRYDNPKQHVLLNKVRDANPFFHLMEAIWMLAGRRDGEFLDYYVKNFSRDFGISGIIPDAYGYRWRYGLRFDQLNEIVTQLHHEPTSRQCILQMWGATDRHDLISHGPKVCNLVVTFRIRDNKLDMTVFNRSNDVIWGCCGSNAVHFPLLQEYVAGRLEVEMGKYWQISTNLHLYEHHIEMFTHRIGPAVMEETRPLSSYLVDNSVMYGETKPLITDPLEIDNDINEVMRLLERMHRSENIQTGNLKNEFMRDVVIPMALAHKCYKNNDLGGSYETIETVAAEDWRTAGRQWFDRRHHGVR